MPEQDDPRNRLVKKHKKEGLPPGESEGEQERTLSYTVKDRQYVLATDNPEEECIECCHECRYFNFSRCQNVDIEGNVSELECADDLPSTISICTDHFSEHDPLTKQCWPWSEAKEPTDWWFRVQFRDCDPEEPWEQCRACYKGITKEYGSEGPDGEEFKPGTAAPLGTIVVRIPKEEEYCTSACGWTSGSIVGGLTAKIIEEKHNGCDARWIPEGCIHECGYWLRTKPTDLTIQNKCEHCCDEHC